MILCFMKYYVYLMWLFLINFGIICINTTNKTMNVNNIHIHSNEIIDLVKTYEKKLISTKNNSSLLKSKFEAYESLSKQTLLTHSKKFDAITQINRPYPQKCRFRFMPNHSQPMDKYHSTTSSGEDILTVLPSVCVIVRTFSSQTHALYSLIFGLLANRYQNLHIYVIDTQKNNKSTFLEDVISEIADCRVQLLTNQMAYVLQGDQFPHHFQDWGYFATDKALNYLLQTGACDYFLFTNGDNYYNLHFFDSVKNYLSNMTTMIAVDFISSHYWKNRRGNQHIHIKAAFEHQKVDLGSVLVLGSSISATPRSRFMYSFDDSTTLWDADWRFFQGILQKPSTTTVVVPRVLMVHQ